MLHLTTRRTGLYLEGTISDGPVFHLKSQWTLLWNLYSSKDWVIELDFVMEPFIARRTELSNWTLLWNFYSSKNWVIEFFTFLRLFDICGSPSVWRLAVEILLLWLSRWTGSQEFQKLDLDWIYLFIFLWSRLDGVLSCRRHVVCWCET